jgi:HD-GYP domain-containing protein (c-di-GMP phosphodiesterase class II)
MTTSQLTLEHRPFSFVPAVLVGVIPLAILIFLLVGYSDTAHHLHTTSQHFYIVSIASGLAGVVSLIVGVAGIRLRNLQVVLLALAFISLGLIFAVHGIATPGYIYGNTQISGVAAVLSLLFPCFWLALSSLDPHLPIMRWLAPRATLLLWTWTAGVLAFDILLFSVPAVAVFLEIDSMPVFPFVAILTIGFAAVAAWRFLQSYRYTRMTLHFALFAAAIWLMISMITIVLSPIWSLAWWEYHVLFVLAIGGVLVGLYQLYGRKASLAVIIGGHWNPDPVARLESAISPHIRELLELTEKHDSYTGGHNYRVALYALELGKAMSLSPEKLRILAQAGVVHDIGKLEIPYSILNKPGKLDPDERQIIERHPVAGWMYCSRFGFMPEELEVIRHHHEKWDGTGYPDQLAGQNIPLLARITAIADVYDALTSKRSYREPWDHFRAREFLLEGSGSHFDPDCLSIWASLTEKGPIKLPPELER